MYTVIVDALLAHETMLTNGQTVIAGKDYNGIFQNASLREFCYDSTDSVIQM